MRQAIYIVLGIIVSIIGITFALKNSQPVDINYYFGLHWSASLALILLAVFVAGFIVASLVSFIVIIRVNYQLSRSKKKIDHLNQEISNLRALPIKDVL